MIFLASKNITQDCKKLKSILRILYLSQIINAATRITSSSKTLLDIIITNHPLNISKSGVISSGLSDHEMVYCVRKINWKRSPELIRTVRNYARYDPAKFCEDVDRAISCSQESLDYSVNAHWSSQKKSEEIIHVHG